MESSLHRQIKSLVARDPQSIEVPLDGYRIDAIDAEGRFVEVQFASLGALRNKVLQLRGAHSLRIIKPIVVGKRIVNLNPIDHSVISSRKSPKKFDRLTIFSELMHFTKCFPHSNVCIDVWQVHVLEKRLAKKKHRFRRKNYTLHDQELVSVENQTELRTPSDLANLLQLPNIDDSTFCTKLLAEQLGIQRWLAQQIAYVLDRCQAVERVGKSGNAHLYRWTENVLHPCRPQIKRRRAKRAA